MLCIIAFHRKIKFCINFCCVIKIVTSYVQLYPLNLVPAIAPQLVKQNLLCIVYNDARNTVDLVLQDFRHVVKVHLL